MTRDPAVTPQHLPAPVDHELSARTVDRMQRSIPTETRRAYERGWAQFADWCTAHGRNALPATPQTLAEYVSALVDEDKAPSTIEQAMAAIRTAHRYAGHRGLPETDQARAVLRVHKRERAERGQRKRKAPAVVLDVLRAMVDALDIETITGVRDRALIVLGFAMMGRRSELAALRASDLVFTDDGLTVLVRSSKTDQDAVGAEVKIPYGSHPSTCPVRTLRAWLAALSEHGFDEGPVFRRITRHGHLQDGAMSGAAINERVKVLAERAGVEGAEKFTAHGLRAGGPTEAARRGVPVAHIAEHGRWSKASPVVHEYVRAADGWRDNPMRGIGL
ncbi:tyrosine-type recombinase/integrase [Streptomyces sp. NPDC002285]